MDCCIGKNRINFGKWYCPNDKNEFSYCEYCYNNGCVDKSAVYEINYPKTTSFDCDCNNQSVHPKIVGLLCPTCDISTYGKMRACVCGTCNNKCGNITSYSDQSYCTVCSFVLKCCYECGKPIKEGNAYLPEIYSIVDKVIDEDKYLLEKVLQAKELYTDITINKILDIETSVDKVIKEDKNLLEKVLQSKELYTDKTVNEMIDILLDKARKMDS